MYVLFSVLLLAVMIGALVDIIIRNDGQIKHLPKVVWVLLVVFIPLVGTVLWFTIGRTYSYRSPENISFGNPRRWQRHTASPSQMGRPRSTEEQLADLEQEIRDDNARRAPTQNGN